MGTLLRKERASIERDHEAALPEYPCWNTAEMVFAWVHETASGPSLQPPAAPVAADNFVHPSRNLLPL
jgi:hypothetical protein